MLPLSSVSLPCLRPQPRVGAFSLAAATAPRPRQRQLLPSRALIFHNGKLQTATPEPNTPALLFMALPSVLAHTFRKKKKRYIKKWINQCFYGNTWMLSALQICDWGSHLHFSKWLSFLAWNPNHWDHNDTLKMSVWDHLVLYPHGGNGVQNKWGSVLTNETWMRTKSRRRSSVHSPTTTSNKM